MPKSPTSDLGSAFIVAPPLGTSPLSKMLFGSGVFDLDLAPSAEASRPLRVKNLSTIEKLILNYNFLN